MPPSDRDLDVDIREMKRSLAGPEPVVMRIAHCLDQELPPLVTRAQLEFEIGELAIIAGQGFEQFNKRLDSKPSRADLWVVASTGGAVGVITAWAVMVLTLHYLHLL